MIGAILRIKNEGSISTRISMTGTYRIDTPLVLDTDEVDRIVREGKPQPDTRLPQSGITIEPGASMEIVVRAGPTLREWIDQGEHPCWIHIRAVTSPEAAAQEWELVLSGQLLNQNFSSASRFDVLAHTLIDTQLVSLPRAYPANLG
ncbi:MAG: hypothetical protein ACRDYB_02610 [Acidimicrobiales bacterium]